jgi:hypothetical protein
VRNNRCPAASRDTRSLAAALALALAAAGAAADDLSGELRRCAAEPADARRLACYDRLAGTVPRASSSPSSASGAAAATGTGVGATGVSAGVSAASAAATSSAAGSPQPAAPPSLADFGVNNGPLEAKKLVNQPKSMSGTVASVSTRAHGELVVTLDNGQVWVQNQAVEFFTLKTGDRVEISVGALGSYTMWVPSIRRMSKVTRID